MIPIKAFVALTLFALTFGAFGVLIGRASKRIEHKEEPTEERHACDTCKWENTRPQDEPCCICVQDDMDMWEKDE